MNETRHEDNEERAVEASQGLFQEYAQVALDAVLSDNVLAHIPIVRSVMLIPKAYLGLRDHLFIRKLEACLRRLDDVPASERRAMVANLESDPAYGRRVGEHLIELIERMESRRKPAMLGEIFGAYARGTINIRIFHRLINAIERLPVMEIDGAAPI